MLLWDLFKPKPKPELEIMNGEFVDEEKDEQAPMVITSSNIVVFELHCNYEMYLDEAKYRRYDVFASKCDEGTFVYFNNKISEEKYEHCCCVTDFRLLDALQDVVDKYEFVVGNGLKRFEYGLDDDYGGGMFIRYENGEYISKADNHYAIIPAVASDEIMELFELASRYYWKQETVPGRDIIAIDVLQQQPNGDSVHYRAEEKDESWKVSRERVFVEEPERNETLSVSVEDEKMTVIRERFEQYCLYAACSLPERNDLSADYGRTSVVFKMSYERDYKLLNGKYAPLFIDGYTYEIQSYLDKLLQDGQPVDDDQLDTEEMEDDGDIH